MNYFEAIESMAKGNVVQYIGTVNGNVFTERGSTFCMMRGVIFKYSEGKALYKTAGHMVYDPDFRYKETGATVDPRDWPVKQSAQVRQLANKTFITHTWFIRLMANW